MTTAITHNATQDLTSPYADIERLFVRWLCSQSGGDGCSLCATGWTRQTRAATAGQRPRACWASHKEGVQALLPSSAPKKRPISPRRRQYNQRQHAEQQAKLEAAFRSMQEQGLPITSETLKNAETQQTTGLPA
jgi:hypothetical protein